MDVRKLLVLVFIGLWLLLLPICAGADVRYTVTDLGTLGVADSTSVATAINDLGEVAGYVYNPVNNNQSYTEQGFLYDGTITT